MIFSKSYCPFCNEAKSVFKELNAEYKSIELDNIEDGDKIQKELFELTGQRTVPNIFINGTHFHNFYNDVNISILDYKLNYLYRKTLRWLR